MQTVTSADGTHIAYERHGDGPPLILLHGGSSHRYWEPVVPHFVGDYTVVVPHRRGHGESGDSEAHDLDREVADVRAVVDDVDGEPTLFGHSFGGLLAVEAARTVAVDRAVAYEPAVLVGEYRDHADLADRMQARLDDGARREATKLYLREVVHGGAPDEFETWLEGWEPWPEFVDLVENVVRINRVVEAYGLPETLDVDVPTLLLTGTEGPPHLREGVRAVRDALPDPRFVEFEGVSHAGPVAAPERIAAEVRAFTGGVEAPEQ